MMWRILKWAAVLVVVLAAGCVVVEAAGALLEMVELSTVPPLALLLIGVVEAAPDEQAVSTSAPPSNNCFHPAERMRQALPFRGCVASTLGVAASRRYCSGGMAQSMGSRPASTSAALVRLKGRDPKKPL